MNILTHSMVRHAHSIARETGAKALMFDADTLESQHDLEQVLKEIDFRVVLLNRGKELPQVPNCEMCTILSVPRVPLSRLAQIKISVLLGVAEKIFERGDSIVCLSGAPSSDRLDMLAVVRVGDEPEFFLTDEINPLPPDVQPPVFEHVLRLTSELAIEGREGRPVGTLFVVGDSEKVLDHSRQSILNPFHGYDEEQRNLLRGDLDETIKEYSAIDGAFIVRGDGVVLSAGRYLMPKGKPAEPLRSGLGARHEAAAAITAVTDAVALVLSQSTATITIFNSGRIMTEIEKLRSSAGEP